MFNSLQEKLESAFKNLKGQGRITELNICLLYTSSAKPPFTDYGTKRSPNQEQHNAGQRKNDLTVPLNFVPAQVSFLILQSRY